MLPFYGFCIFQVIAFKGWKVLAIARNLEKLENLKKENPNCDILSLDLTDKKAIEQAKRRLGQYLRETSTEMAKRQGDNERFAIRVPFDKNVRGKVIGRGGENIKKIQQRMGIAKLDISWDDNAKELLVCPPMLLDPKRQEQLRCLIKAAATAAR